MQDDRGRVTRFLRHPGVEPTEFLTFDGNQKKLTEAEGLVVPL